VNNSRNSSIAWWGSWNIRVSSPLRLITRSEVKKECSIPRQQQKEEKSVYYEQVSNESMLNSIKNQPAHSFLETFRPSLRLPVTLKCVYPHRLVASQDIDRSGKKFNPSLRLPCILLLEVRELKKWAINTNTSSFQEIFQSLLNFTIIRKNIFIFDEQLKLCFAKFSCSKKSFQWAGSKMQDKVSKRRREASFALSWCFELVAQVSVLGFQYISSEQKMPILAIFYTLTFHASSSLAVDKRVGDEVSLKKSGNSQLKSTSCQGPGVMSDLSLHEVFLVGSELNHNRRPSKSRAPDRR
jgi:hypothetical protein